MTKHYLLFAGLAYGVIAAANAADPLMVLGLPLGGKLKLPLPRCRTNDANVRELCQSGPATVMTATAQELIINVPGTDQRPKWAANVGFQAWVARDGTLRSFNVKTYRSDAFVEILNSITGRFGQSQTESVAGSRLMAATWDRPDIHIELLCSERNGCMTTFTSAAAQAEHVTKVAAQKAKDANRSSAP